MIGSSVPAAPVILEHRDVDVPAAHRLRAFRDRLHRLCAHRQRRHPRRRRQALLRPAVADVDPPVVDPQLAAGERGDRIGEQQRPVLMRDPRDLLERLKHARARLAVHNGDDLYPPSVLQRRLDPLRLDQLAPVRLDKRDLAAAAPHHVRHPHREVPILADDDRIARLDDVVDRRLHPCRAGARNRHREVVLRPEHRPQRPLRVVEQLDEHRVKVPDHRRGHRAVHPRVHERRPRPEEQPVGDVQFAKVVRHDAPDESTLSIRSCCFSASLIACSGPAPTSTVITLTWDIRLFSREYTKYCSIARFS